MKRSKRRSRKSLCKKRSVRRHYNDGIDDNIRKTSQLLIDFKHSKPDKKYGG
jgi:hypothetical protein